jgi:hypothetical protein
MFIMNSRKMIYVHLQKCGGTSIEVSLFEKARWDDVLIGSSLIGELVQWEYFGKFGLHKHSVAKEIQPVVGKELWTEYYSWCTVRNPYARAVSLYNYTVALVESYAAQAGFPLDGERDDQSAWSERDDYPTTEPWSYPAVRAYLVSRRAERPFSSFLRDPGLHEDSAFQPQWWGVQDVDGEAQAVDEIVKLEELDADWPRVCEKIGLPGLPVMRENVSTPAVRRTPAELFDSPEDMAFMRERFHEDFMRFGYDPDIIP